MNHSVKSSTPANPNQDSKNHTVKRLKSGIRYSIRLPNGQIEPYELDSLSDKGKITLFPANLDSAEQAIRGKNFNRSTGGFTSLFDDSKHYKVVFPENTIQKSKVLRDCSTFSPLFSKILKLSGHNNINTRYKDDTGKEWTIRLLPYTVRGVHAPKNQKKEVALPPKVTPQSKSPAYRLSIVDKI